MNIVFMGTPEFSTGILKGLIENYNVLLVVTQPDKKVGRKQVLKKTPVKEVALLNNIEVFQPSKIKNNYQKVIDYKPDMIITAAYGQMIPEEIINYPRYGCINVHGSLLPKFRGGSPMHRAITTGEKETGITIMHMIKKMDAGDIISQRGFPILDSDTVGSIHDKLSKLGIELLLETLPLIISGNYQRIKQDESKVTYAYNITKEEQKIDFNKNSICIYNHIRGFNPWPGTYTKIDDYIIKIHASKVINDFSTMTLSDKKNGEILDLYDNMIYIRTNDGVIGLTEIQLQGKRKMSIKDFMNGKGKDLIKVGKILK